jgi:ubiquinone/menaquinone biosynthesis C-methylase UbiE
MMGEGLRNSPDDIVQYRYERYLKKALQEHGVSLDTHTKVLEIGSGNGRMLENFKKDGADAIGVDMHPRGSGETLQVKAKIENLPFADESFDLVVSTQAFDRGIYHEQDQDAMGKEIVRVLKAGGLYVAFVELIENVPAGLTLVSDKESYKTAAVYKKENSVS